ncbi:MAG: glycoside hydrolase/phage tail family protein [Pseudomonadota bacterium]
MAQLVITAATTAASAVGKAGIGTIIAKTAASAATSYAAGAITNAIFGPRKRATEGPRIDSFSLQASTEGAGMPRVYGRARVAGQLIWASRFKETKTTTIENSGGKGSGGSSVETEITEYAYSASFAVGLCQGKIDRVTRAWADGKPFDLSKVQKRIYRGTETQTPDDLLVAVEGSVPAFRGLAYIVFEDLPLAAFGNRIPQLSFEVERALRDKDPDSLENALTSVSMIPSSGEFVYGTTKVLRQDGEGVTVAENTHNSSNGTDLYDSVNALKVAAPNVAHTSLIVSWFGNDLRAGSCTLRPGVENYSKTTTPYEWSVGGTTRQGGHLISTINSGAAYGGTPADKAVLEGIARLKERGIAVQFHPFILMDVPPGNNLPKPEGGTGQAPFPWRGRISVGTKDKTNAAATDINAFFGTASPSHFSTSGGTVNYTGPNEWSFRRFILHYAHLCKLAGGIEAFLIGSEMRGITTARSASGVFPAIAALKALAADVRSVLGSSTKISYAADWSEYFGHHANDSSGDVYFHLDPLWSDANIDFIGIDNYLPLADWRDGFDHLDAATGTATAPISQYDLDYLMGNMRAGERYDWYYPNDAARQSQTRYPIIDGSGEPWVFRAKDFWNWWSSAHHNRPGGVRSSSATAWVPQSKPIRFTELGCPAIDKGANQPNVFVDPKSSENAFPYHSSGARDDLIQRRFIEAHLKYWKNSQNNPTSNIYSGRMVEADKICVYAWDARPFPYFPALSDIWGDTENWRLGHWLNGRLGRAPLSLLVKEIAEEANASVNTAQLHGTVGGYLLDRPMSAREAIDPLADLFQFDAVEDPNYVLFQQRDRAPVASLSAQDFVADDDFGLTTGGNTTGDYFTMKTGQLSDLPDALRVGYIDETNDFQPAAAEAIEPGRTNVNGTAFDIPVIAEPSLIDERARALLSDAHVMREHVSFALPPSRMTLQPGDIVDVNFDTTSDSVHRRLRITEVTDGHARSIEATRQSPYVFGLDGAASAPFGISDSYKISTPPVVYGQPAWELLDLPMITDSDDPTAPWFAAFADPWPGTVSLYRSGISGSDDRLSGTSTTPAGLGQLLTPLAPTASPLPSGRWLNQSIQIRLGSGSVVSRPETDVLAGANGIAVFTASGRYEIIQFRDAVLESDGTWTLSRLLRGQAGTEQDASAGAVVGARIVLLNSALRQSVGGLDARGINFQWKAGPSQRSTTDDSYSSKSQALALRGLSPLSPCHLRAESINGDLLISWVRRTRIGGDTWDVEEVPLGEAFERYRLEIATAANTVGQYEMNEAVFAYTTAMQINDLGSGYLGDIFIRVAQLSADVGAGDKTELKVTLS